MTHIVRLDKAGVDRLLNKSLNEKNPKKFQAFFDYILPVLTDYEELSS